MNDLLLFIFFAGIVFFLIPSNRVNLKKKLLVSAVVSIAIITVLKIIGYMISSVWYLIVILFVVMAINYAVKKATQKKGE